MLKNIEDGSCPKENDGVRRWRSEMLASQNY